jgi:hypothetical protein
MELEDENKKKKADLHRRYLSDQGERLKSSKDFKIFPRKRTN